MSSLWPLFDRYPGLGGLPRVALRTAVTPVEQVGERLWVKRDDLTADPVGGNKVRSLELLLGAFKRGDRIFTAGSRGSTHVLSTVVHARRLGMEVDAASWPQEMNDVARAVDARLESETRRRHFSTPVAAYLWLAWKRLRGANVIPLGGTSALGALGHVNAAFELAEQIRAGVLPVPKRIVVPFGTGGTVAGLWLGFTLAGVETELIAARVVPRIVGRRAQIARIFAGAHRVIRDLTGDRDEPRRAAIRVVHEVYGGAYGRPLPHAPARAGDTPLDPTYAAKGFAAAQESARDADTLFWLTFDSRWIASGK